MSSAEYTKTSELWNWTQRTFLLCRELWFMFTLYFLLYCDDCVQCEENREGLTDKLIFELICCLIIVCMWTLQRKKYWSQPWWFMYYKIWAYTAPCYGRAIGTLVTYQCPKIQFFFYSIQFFWMCTKAQVSVTVNIFFCFCLCLSSWLIGCCNIYCIPGND